jgi:hypothetical protein
LVFSGYIVHPQCENDDRQSTKRWFWRLAYSPVPPFMRRAMRAILPSTERYAPDFFARMQQTVQALPSNPEWA